MGKQKPQFLYGRRWYMLAVIDAGCHTRHLQERADVGRVRLPLTALSGRCRYVARPSALTPPGAPVLPRTDY